MSIAPNYQGVAEAAGGYSLAPMQGYVKDSADALRAATQVIASGVADMQEQVAAAMDIAVSLAMLVTSYHSPSGPRNASPTRAFAMKDVPVQSTALLPVVTATVPVLYQVI